MHDWTTLNSFCCGSEQKSETEKKHERWLYVTEVPEDAKERFILKGYRPFGMSPLACVRSALSYTNETLNIWTHLIAAIYFIHFYWNDQRLRHFYSSHSWSTLGPLALYQLSLVVIFAFSAWAHLFNSMSAVWRHMCFMLDYVGICFYAMCSAIVYCYYSGDGNKAFDAVGHTNYVLIMTLVTISMTWITCQTRCADNTTTSCGKSKRATCFGVLFWMGIIPIIIRGLDHISLDSVSCMAHHMTTLSSNPLDFSSHCRHDTLSHLRLFRSVVLMGVSGLLLVKRIPECWSPGLFDIIGHSHILMHISSFYSMREHFLLQLDNLAYFQDPNSNVMSGFEYLAELATASIITIVLASVFIILLTAKRIIRVYALQRSPSS